VREAGRDLDPELAQVVIEVFVHPAAPFLRREYSEKRVWMLRTFRFPTVVELPEFLL
jgi:hypothetical protein